MYSSILVAKPVAVGKQPYFLTAALFALYLIGTAYTGPKVGQAAWFPAKPEAAGYQWQYRPCKGCAALAPQREWTVMQHLAGLSEVHYLLSPNDKWGDGYTFPPDAVVLSGAALKLPRCQLNFVVGHELVHIARHHFDQDARMAAVLSGVRPNWTHNGRRALSLLNGDYVLALRMAPTWQAQEEEADWLGSLLAAQASGCTIEEGALPYFRNQTGQGGGIGAAHAVDAERIRFVEKFVDSSERLAKRWAALAN